ncbi:carboxymuconolactone decarboxylase family protein [Luteolibacter marinus]|uniref:carboxymuconolactone decarboxylase family protein n=1 Tax=Luteolibacter marinus TaxID=2776705 RepID=UPI001868FDD2|nr:carboxymuconolactone decarboxylase family protein [Luteolibacter marinus]
MNRLNIVPTEGAPEEIATLYGAVKQKLGLVPNMVKALGNSRAALEGYLSLSGALSGGRLPAATREKIALRVAELNRCGYCLSAHTAIGGLLKIPASALTGARAGYSADAREQAILDLVEAIVETRGNVADAAYRAAVGAGLDEEAITEVAANVALNVFTNYFNRLAATEIDFPEVGPLETGGECDDAACACQTAAAV